MKNQPVILACTDFTPYSDHALRAAEEVRQKTNGKLHVLHVSELPVLWDWVPEGGTPALLDEQFEFELIKTLRKKLHGQMEQCGVHGEAHISLGLAHARIPAEAEECKADLIIVGHKGKTGGLFRIGSIAEKIIASSSVPVLVSKGALKINKVAALVDPTSSMDKILQQGEEVARIFSAQFEVISLISDLAARWVGIGKLGFSTELLSLTDEEKMKIKTEVSTHVREKLREPEKAIIRVEVSTERKVAYHLNSILDEDRVDLAIMRRHQETMLEKLLIGSETRRMLELREGNILVLPPSS